MYVCKCVYVRSAEVFINYIYIITYFIAYYPIHTLPFFIAEYITISVPTITSR